MTNAELIAKIKAEIERLENYYTSVERHIEALISFLSTLESKKPMQEELDKEIKRYLQEIYDRDTTVGDVARHFAKWQKEQMMKEAVEGEVIKDNRGNNVLRVGLLNNGFEFGDKVRVIVCKKEGE